MGAKARLLKLKLAHCREPGFENYSPSAAFALVTDLNAAITKSEEKDRELKSPLR